MEKKWIKVKNRLPRQGKKVLVLWKNSRNVKSIDIAVCWKGDHDYSRKWHFRYNDVDGSNILDDSQVIGWQHLPSIL